MKTKNKPKLQLTGMDGNAFVLLGLASKVAKKEKMKNWEEIRKEAMSGNYDHVLQTLMKYFDVS